MACQRFRTWGFKSLMDSVSNWTVNIDASQLTFVVHQMNPGNWGLDWTLSDNQAVQRRARVFSCNR
ncbi:hypothetical protein BCAR13_500018 [Paraburkholderia caribensis]|nr:hypothetical protein BCAR13_500018 [Paraburkholderia caribensis]